MLELFWGFVWTCKHSYSKVPIVDADFFICGKKNLFPKCLDLSNSNALFSGEIRINH